MQREQDNTTPIEIDTGGQEPFIEWLLTQQYLFETQRVGLDGSLYETLGLEGKVSGIEEELEECRTEILAGNLELAREEAVDVLIRVAALITSLEMCAEELKQRTIQKTRVREQKYPVENFTGRTVREAMVYSKRSFTDMSKNKPH